MDKMKVDILSALTSLDPDGEGVPFSRLGSIVDGLVNPSQKIKGHTLVSASDSLVHVWVGFTNKGIKSVLDLLADGALAMRPCDQSRYPKELFRPVLPVVTSKMLCAPQKNKVWFPALIFLPN